MAIEQHAYVGALSVARADLREGQKDLGTGIDAANRPVRGRLVILSDVVVDLLQPSLRLGGPDYLRHDSKVFPTSSWLLVRPACESARPRSIIAANANSLEDLVERAVVRLLLDDAAEPILRRRGCDVHATDCSAAPSVEPVAAFSEAGSNHWMKTGRRFDSVAGTSISIKRGVGGFLRQIMPLNYCK